MRRIEIPSGVQRSKICHPMNSPSKLGLYLAIALGGALRSAWYATNMLPTGGVYTVTADFQPGADANWCRGGVMGWLNLGSSNGISFQVRPTDSFRVSVINFTADNGSDNESVNGLFDLNGSTNDIDSANGAELGAN